MARLAEPPDTSSEEEGEGEEQAGEFEEAEEAEAGRSKGREVGAVGEEDDWEVVEKDSTVAAIKRFEEANKACKNNKTTDNTTDKITDKTTDTTTEKTTEKTTDISTRTVRTGVGTDKKKVQQQTVQTTHTKQEAQGVDVIKHTVKQLCRGGAEMLVVSVDLGEVPMKDVVLDISENAVKISLPLQNTAKNSSKKEGNSQKVRELMVPFPFNSNGSLRYDADSATAKYLKKTQLLKITIPLI